MSEATPEVPETTPVEGQQETAEQGDAEKAPPWGDDFNPQMAWDRIQKQARDIDRLRAQGVLTDDHRTKLSEYDRLVEASKTDLERLQESEKAARERATTLQSRLAAAEVKTALTGVVADPAAVVEDLNLARFIGDDGEVNAEAVQALRAKYEGQFAAATEKPGMKPNPSQGSSASPAPSVNDQIAKAQAAGDFKTAIRLNSARLLNTSDN